MRPKPFPGPAWRHYLSPNSCHGKEAENVKETVRDRSRVRLCQCSLLSCGLRGDTGPSKPVTTSCTSGVPAGYGKMVYEKALQPRGCTKVMASQLARGKELWAGTEGVSW